MSRSDLWGAPAAIFLRYALLVMAGVWVVGQWQKGQTPRMLSIDSAHASVPVGAAVSYLSFTTRDGGESKFFITDTAKKVIVTYGLNGGQLRLISARKFDEDLKLVDGSVPAPVALETVGNGMTRDEVKIYAKNSKAQLDALAKKLGQGQMTEAE